MGGMASTYGQCPAHGDSAQHIWTVPTGDSYMTSTQDHLQQAAARSVHRVESLVWSQACDRHLGNIVEINSSLKDAGVRVFASREPGQPFCLIDLIYITLCGETQHSVRKALGKSSVII